MHDEIKKYSPQAGNWTNHKDVLHKFSQQLIG